MKKMYKSLDELIGKNLADDEFVETSRLMADLKCVKSRGYFTKDEFLKMGMWKSPRPKQRYLRNSGRYVSSISKKVFSARSEEDRIGLLTNLDGVSIPTASAILTLVDPKNYGVIDIRVWQVLYLYGSANEKPNGTNFSLDNWLFYLNTIRSYAKKFDVTARDIERTLFLHHRAIQEGTLYNYFKK